MRKVVFLLAAIGLMASCGIKIDNPETLTSPDGKLELRVGVAQGGVPAYELFRDGKAVVKPSRLGFELIGQDDLKDGFSVASATRDSFDETWEPVWGEESSIRNHYNELLVCFTREDGVNMNLRFRLYDEGLGFRYEFPMENKLIYFNIKEELTEFAMTGNHTAWWISGDYDSQEYNYTCSRLRQIPSLNHKSRIYQASQEEINKNCVQTALQMKTDDGLYINIHEAAVVDYPTTNLELKPCKLTFRTWLTPDAQDVKGRMQAPCNTPWRTVMVCEKATDVLASRLILNLNEPCALDDVSWIHPVKYMGVWWEMITGKTQWSYTYDFPSIKLGVTDYSKATPHGNHGANNENVRRYIDFAADNGFDAILIEGWNEGWEDWFGCKKDYVFDFVTPYPDFDLPALNKYAHEKGIRLIMHHETSSSTLNYERHLEEAYDLMNKYGYDAVKSGYVGEIIPYGERHYSQPLINHYLYCIKEAAKHHIMVNAHEAVRPTGLCRTYPNMIGNESAMGGEYRSRINPGHTTILPFTRLQGGPMDYTPGIVEQDMAITAPGQTGKMRHTICNHLGLYVTFYSPLQMAADLPENYERFMDAFQFIKDVAVDWDQSLYLSAEPGSHIIVARHPKVESLNKSQASVATLADGKKNAISGAARFVYAMPATATSISGAYAHDVWYVGGITGEEAMDYELALDFLKPDIMYEATIYRDGDDADYETAPQSYKIEKTIVKSTDVLQMHMARSGGFAISLREVYVAPTKTTTSNSGSRPHITAPVTPVREPADNGFTPPLHHR